MKKEKYKSPSVNVRLCLLIVACLCIVYACINVVNGKNNPASTSTNVESLSEIEAISSTQPDAMTNALSTYLSHMTLDEKIYQMFIITPEALVRSTEPQTVVNKELKEALENAPVGGIVLFASNIRHPKQCKDLLYDLQNASSIPLFLAVDEEGGSVARLGNNPNMKVKQIPSMKTIGAAQNVEQAYSAGKTLGKTLERYGFNVDFAPVCDISSNPGNTVIGDRSFGDNPKLVANMVTAIVQGFNQSNVICTLKHFPGHGDTSFDSHFNRVVIDKSIEELNSFEFVPFKAGICAGAEMIMMGHISNVTVIGDQRPASLSKTMVTDILRSELGYNGVVITDSMLMQAITNYYSSGEAAAMAVKAGVDIILAPADLIEAAAAIKNAVITGDISENRINESVVRILALKAKHNIIQF